MFIIRVQYVATVHEKTLAMKHILLQVWCHDIISHVTKSVFNVCVRTGIENIESTSHVLRGNAIEHLKWPREFCRLQIKEAICMSKER